MVRPAVCSLDVEDSLCLQAGRARSTQIARTVSAVQDVARRIAGALIVSRSVLFVSKKFTSRFIRSPRLYQTIRIKRSMDYFCATNSRARLSSGRVELDPSQTFNRSA